MTCFRLVCIKIIVEVYNENEQKHKAKIKLQEQLGKQHEFNQTTDIE